MGGLRCLCGLLAALGLLVASARPGRAFEPAYPPAVVAPSQPPVGGRPTADPQGARWAGPAWAEPRAATALPPSISSWQQAPTLAEPSNMPTTSVGTAPGVAPGMGMAPGGSDAAGGISVRTIDPAAPAWYGRAWQWQILPEGLLYKSYLAGVKESRFAAQWVHERSEGWIWDIALGGRVGVVRYGTEGSIDPEGWQIDLEGAALPRLDLREERDLVACDYRFGVPLTLARGRHQTKLAYYHLSSHLGDEWMIRHPSLTRINYSRDALVLGHSVYFGPRLRVYGEAGWAFETGECTKPWEFQFGVEYSQREPGPARLTPFAAVNGHLREEVDFGGNLTVQSGWQWRGPTGRLLRVGVQYLVGMSDQYEFYDQYESKVGLGVWYDY